MTEGVAVPRLVHPALDDGDADGRSVGRAVRSVRPARAASTPLEDARLGDQQRLAVLLQAASVLAHLEHAGLALDPQEPGHPWADARVDAGGVLRGLRTRPGRQSELPQSLLLRLVRLLFRSTEDEIAGRGAARRVVRELVGLWRQELEPQSPDQAVGQILDAAPFLWREVYDGARAALAAEVLATDGSRRPWMAGPGHIRRRFLRRVTEIAAEQGADLEGLQALVTGAEARDLWDGVGDDADPAALRRRGRLRRAAAAWRRTKRRTKEQTLAFARCLADLGRFADAAELLLRRTDFEAVLLRARCLLDLGERGAAEKALRKLDTDDLGPWETVEVARVAVRLASARGPLETLRGWMTRLLEASEQLEGAESLRALLVAAGAAFDAGEERVMADYLEQARPALEVPHLAGLWHHMEGLRRLHAGDGLGAAEHVGLAIGTDRRHLPPARVGRLWNDLAVARALADDLPGAERACRHALRLLGRVQGPARLTLALYNLAEVRLRRGRLQGVVGTLERSTAENRKVGNQRGLLLDLELWTRLELAQGRAAAALARCAEAARLIEAGAPGRSQVFDLFAARAEGWLGRPERAAERLARVEPETLGELEPEERPAVFALAGRTTEAALEAHGTPWEPLWTALLAAEHPPVDAWESLDLLESFRAARLVLDAETLVAGVTPPARLRRAIAGLRSLGAEPFAEALEQRSSSPWLALRTYLETPRADEEPAATLLRAAGYAEARLDWRHDDVGSVLVPGTGGEHVLEAPAAGGTLRLATPVVDGVLEALFALLRDDLDRVLSAHPVEASDPETFGGEPGLRDGIVGSSAALCAALDRLDRLASGDLPLLVLGESGTGKELMARRAHRQSRRHAGPFLPINCAALSDSLIQSDLFGHVRGSFTGADRDRAGVFEAARGGTVFLDEIGDLPLPSQGKLLRVLQEGEIRRVGESFARKVDVRVVAATHRDLARMVEDGEFRQDLFYRLRVAKVELPALRDRGRDVARLAEHLLRKIPGGPGRLSRAARERLETYSWPGNVRELRNILEVASALADGDEVGPQHLDLADAEPAQQALEPLGDYHQQVESLRRRLVGEALRRAEGNRAEAARNLGLTRQALSYLVKQLDLS